jgi:hypothetical protein
LLFHLVVTIMTYARSFTGRQTDELTHFFRKICRFLDLSEETVFPLLNNLSAFPYVRRYDRFPHGRSLEQGPRCSLPLVGMERHIDVGHNTFFQQ